jgi:hypothetical protein
MTSYHYVKTSYHYVKKLEDENYDYILDLIYRKNMFETLLKKTLEELNKTNPCLECCKYNTLCLYSNRYGRFIKHINYLIIKYELEKENYIKKDNRCHWCWKTMKFNLSIHFLDNLYYIEKNINDKKND